MPPLATIIRHNRWLLPLCGMTLLTCAPTPGWSQQGQHRNVPPTHVDPAFLEAAKATGGRIYTIDPNADRSEYERLGQRMLADQYAQPIECGSTAPLRETLADSRQLFRLVLPRGSTSFSVIALGGQGRVQVLLKQGSLPRPEDFDAASDEGSVSEARIERATTPYWYINALSLGPIRDKQLQLRCR